MGSFNSKPRTAPLTIDALDMGRHAMLRDLVRYRNAEQNVCYKKDTKTYTTRHSELRHDKACSTGGIFL